MENVLVSFSREGQRVSKDMPKPGVHPLTLSSLLTILYLSATYIFYKQKSLALVIIDSDFAAYLFNALHPRKATFYWTWELIHFETEFNVTDLGK